MDALWSLGGEWDPHRRQANGAAGVGEAERRSQVVVHELNLWGPYGPSGDSSAGLSQGKPCRGRAVGSYKVFTSVVPLIFLLWYGSPAYGHG